MGRRAAHRDCRRRRRGGESAGRARDAEARASARPFIARPAPPPHTRLPARLPLLPRGRSRPELSLPPAGRTEPSRPRHQLADMASPAGPRVTCREAAVSRTLLLLLGWVLVQVAGASGEWQPPPWIPGALGPKRGVRTGGQRARPARRSPAHPPAWGPAGARVGGQAIGARDPACIC